MKIDPCPHCGRKNEVHANITNETQPPEKGDVSLCWDCKEPAVFDDDKGTLRLPTADERADIMQQPVIRDALYAMAESTRPTEAKEMFQTLARGRHE